MASKSSIAIRRNSAIDRCKDAIRVIWGEEFELPLRFRDPSMLAAIQLEAIADYLDCKAQGVSIQVDVDLDNLPPEATISTGLTAMQTLKVADKPGRKPTGRTRKK